MPETLAEKSGPSYTQPSSNVVFVRRRKRKVESPMRQLSKWFVENQTGLCFNLLALLFLAHTCVPKARAYTSRFFSLQYHNPATGQYGVGFDDVYIISFFIVLFTGLRASTMDYLLAPFAKSRGITLRKGIIRFTEQAWMLVYYSVFWPMGVWIYYNSPYFLNLRELWTDWPNREVTGLMKVYVLAQLSFWVQQIIVIHIEARRKDHWQMLTHHIVTISLIQACYRYHHTRVGNLILVLMDVVDLFLPAAKCLKYLGYATLCDIMFGIFAVSWFVARHVFYMMVCYSVWAQSPNVVNMGCFRGTNADLEGPFLEPRDSYFYLLEPLINNSGLVCYTETVKWSFLSALLFLQALTIMWFTMIITVIVRVLRGDGADDVRSDDEESEGIEGEDGDGLEGDPEFVYEEAQPLEEEVGADAIDFKGWERRSGVVRGKASSSSGVSLPGHSDRKELLGRIGCEKQVD